MSGASLGGGAGIDVALERIAPGRELEGWGRRRGWAASNPAGMRGVRVRGSGRWAWELGD